MKIPDNVLNPTLYKKARQIAEKVYGPRTSAYRSMYITTQYKKLGGKYSQAKSKKSTRKWLDEQWIIVQDYLNHGKIVACGAYKRNKHACRPLKRIDSKTPITIKEVIKKHGKAKTKQLAKQKEKHGTKVRLDWKSGTFHLKK